MCSDGELSLRVGPNIYLGMGKDESNVTMTFPDIGNYSFQVFYNNRYIEKLIKVNRTVGFCMFPKVSPV